MIKLFGYVILRKHEYEALNELKDSLFRLAMTYEEQRQISDELIDKQKDCIQFLKQSNLEFLNQIKKMEEGINNGQHEKEN